LDVGQGDAILVTGRRHQQVLVDAGPDASVMGQLGSAMPLGDRTIEAAVISHPHADHYRGFRAVLERYRIGVVYVSAVRPQDGEYQALLTDAAARGTRVVSGRAGDVAGWSDISLRFETFGEADPPPRNLNNASVVATVTVRGRTIFLPGDAEREQESRLVRQGLKPVDILKVPHHGSRTSSTDELVGVLRPKFAVISVGARNRYGHPAAETVDRLRAAGAMVYRTDQAGAVTLKLSSWPPQVWTER
jgi:competence protein ComEC